MRFLLYPFSLVYDAITRVRNYLFDSGRLSSVRFDLPVIAVGNLSTGGTGKTPHVEYLIRLLRDQFKVATMSRGYKRKSRGFLLAGQNVGADQIGDEPMQYFSKFPDILVSVAEERMTGIPDLIGKHPEVEVVLLDDAYQHRTVRPGFNILLTEYEQPYFKDSVLPMGRLRESKVGAKRADVIIVTKCPSAITQQEADNFVRQLNPLSHQRVFFTGFKYGQPYEIRSKENYVIAGQPIVIVAGIARPEAFIKSISDLGQVVEVLRYRDHHYFTAADVVAIQGAVKIGGANTIVLTTEKDAQRLRLWDKQLQDITIIAAPISVEFLFGQQAEFDKVILNYVTGNRHDKN